MCPGLDTVLYYADSAHPPTTAGQDPVDDLDDDLFDLSEVKCFKPS